MPHGLFRTLAIASLVGMAGIACAQSRIFEFTYHVEIPPQPTTDGPVDVFLPLAQSDEHQQILERKIRASIPGQLRTESKYGNRFWHGHLDQGNSEPITVAVDYRVRREALRKTASTTDARGDTAAEPAALKKFLQPNRRVPVDDPVVQEVLEDIDFSGDTALDRARAIYEYVIDSMEYKKIGTGWGNGDTFWACSQRYGNCTDYHALFTSLARAKGIPARFEIGFPIPLERPQGSIGGYHCWVQFYTPQTGWFPVDASEADKHPRKRAMFFGSQPPDRLRFSIGRDLQLGQGHDSGPLNYFIYPHVEAGNKVVEGVTTRFRYRERPEARTVSLSQ